MKYAYVWTVVTSVAILGAAAGFWFGVLEGSKLGLMIDMPPRAAISLAHINAIERGATHNSVILLESDIDNALVWSSYLDENPMHRLLEPLWGFSVEANHKYLTRLADYRKQHPSPLRPEALEANEHRADEDKEFRAWLIQGAQEQQDIVSRMVDRYATKSGAPK